MQISELRRLLRLAQSPTCWQVRTRRLLVFLFPVALPLWLGWIALLAIGIFGTFLWRRIVAFCNAPPQRYQRYRKRRDFSFAGHDHGGHDRADAGHGGDHRLGGSDGQSAHSHRSARSARRVAVPSILRSGRATGRR